MSQEEVAESGVEILPEIVHHGAKEDRRGAVDVCKLGFIVGFVVCSNRTDTIGLVDG